jgi:hypothetical protein
MYFFPSDPWGGGKESRVIVNVVVHVYWMWIFNFVYLMLLVFGNYFKIDPPFIVQNIPNSLAGYIKLVSVSLTCSMFVLD